MSAWKNLKDGNELSKYLTALLKFIDNNYFKAINGKAVKKNVGQAVIAKTVGIESTRLSKAKSFDSHGDITKEIIKEYIQRVEYVYQVTQKDDNFVFLSAEEWSSLKLLGEKLALNLIDVSTSFQGKDKPHYDIVENVKILEKRKQPSSRTPRERFIAVVGAGASHLATGKTMPLNRDGAEIIRKMIKDPVINELIEKELDRLRLVFKLDPKDFETQLLACSKYRREKVLQGLKKICGVKYVPALTYEILAHMLKHRLIDIIINFNYDEILDNIIEEEVSNGEYLNIYSDGHCPNEYSDLLIHNRLKQPVYIKPHGTISHQSTLRYTREDYFTIPPQIRETIYNLFKSELPGENAGQEYLPLNLLFFGFSLQSFEFTELIKKYMVEYPDRIIKFWFFDIKTKLEDFHLDLSPELYDRFKNNAFFFDLNRHPLKKILRVLWTSIEKAFKPPFGPRGIERHLLINSLLQSFQKKLADYEVTKAKRAKRLREYFRHRFYIELVISLLQSDGILNFNQIVEDRAGKYFQLFKNSRRKGGGDNIDLRTLCEKIGLVVYKGFVWDTFVLETPSDFYQGKNFYSDLYRKLCEAIGHDTNPVEEEEFRDLAHKIKKRNLMKITPDYNHLHKHLFSNIKTHQVLNTGLTWIYQFRSFLEQKEEWDLLLTVSEKGRFLNNDIESDFFHDKKLELVLASFDLPEFPDVAKINFDKLNLLSKKPLFLPWWLHNQHMVIFLKRQKNNHRSPIKNWTIQKGFYYESRMLSRRIIPTLVTHKDDLKVMLYIFANYWYRAREYTNGKEQQKDKAVRIISGKPEMDNIVNELLELFEE